MKQYETEFFRELWRDSEYGSSFSIEINDAIGLRSVLTVIVMDYRSRFAFPDFPPKMV